MIVLPRPLFGFSYTSYTSYTRHRFARRASDGRVGAYPSSSACHPSVGPPIRVARSIAATLPRPRTGEGTAAPLGCLAAQGHGQVAPYNFLTVAHCGHEVDPIRRKALIGVFQQAHRLTP